MARERGLPRTSSRWGASDAKALLADCRQRGLPLAAYCRRRKISYERLRRWRSKLEGQVSPEETPDVGLRPVRLLPSTASDLVIECGDGRSIRLAPDFDPEALRRLLSVLEA